MDRRQVTDLILAARLHHGLTWQSLADALERPVVWSTSALLGQHPLTPAQARTIAGMLDLPREAEGVLVAVPVRGVPDEMANDPTIYRFHEALAVYGGALKELIHEQFGDGIMSAINFSMTIERKAHPAGDRVVVTFDGKFLPYEWTASPGAPGAPGSAEAGAS